MWNDAKQRQLDELRRRKQEGTLTSDEQKVLVQLLHELEQEEWHVLQPSLENLRQEQTELEQDRTRLSAQNAILGAITERQADLLARAKAQLTVLLNEQATLRHEYERAFELPTQETLR